MNIYDYINWRGDLTFDRDPLNIVDNLLFTYAAYVDLREVIRNSEPITIRKAAEEFFKLHTEEECLKSGSLIAHAPVVFRRMSETARFGNILITDYVRAIDADQSQQFSAMHFVIDRKTDYIAFCGTDDTIVGWKEDFQLSYKTVRAQQLAAEYLNSTARKMFRNYIVGGHSKGGALAVYGAMEAAPAVKKKILAIYSNDGPGISSISLNDEKLAMIKDRMIKIIPQLSVFGLLFDNGEKKVVVVSDRSGLYEHDPVSWQVTGTDFVRGKLSDDCVVIQQVLMEFLDTMSIAEREDLVNEMYSAFVKADIVNTTDFTQKGIPVVFKFLKEVTSLNENARKSLDKLISVMRRILSEKAEDAVKKKVKDMSDSISDLLKSTGKKKDKEDTVTQQQQGTDDRSEEK